MRQASVLGPHVLRLACGDRAPLFRVGKDGVGGIGVHMDLQDVARDPHHHRATEAVHRLPDVIGRRRGTPRTSTSVQNWEIPLGVEAGHRRWNHRLAFERHHCGQDGVAVDRAHEHFDHPDKSLTACIDDAGLLQDGHHLRRLGEDHFGLVVQPAHGIADVRCSGRGQLGGPGSVAGDGEDGPLPRLVEGAFEGVGPTAHRRGDDFRIGGDAVVESFGKTIRKCASIIPGIAARAEEGRPRRRGGGVRKRGVAERPEASATARSVSVKLVPVSPSGTGKTLIRFSSSLLAATQSAAA